MCHICEGILASWQRLQCCGEQCNAEFVLLDRHNRDKSIDHSQQERKNIYMLSIQTSESEIKRFMEIVRELLASLSEAQG